VKRVKWALDIKDIGIWMGRGGKDMGELW